MTPAWLAAIGAIEIVASFVLLGYLVAMWLGADADPRKWRGQITDSIMEERRG